MRVRTAVVVVALVAPAALAPPAGAEPADAAPRCGDLLVRDVTLQQDMSCEKGLELAPGVTLDLGGFALTGPWEYAGTGVTGPLAGHATVRNGLVGNWAVAIAADGGGSLHVEGVTADGGVGIRQAGGPLTVVDSHLRGRSAGLECRGSCDVRSTRFEGDETGTGIDCSRGGSCRVTGSTFRWLEVAAGDLTSLTDSVVRDTAAGVWLSGGNVVVARNHVERNGSGVSVLSEGATIADNVFRGNDVGLYVEAPRPPATEVVGNLFTENSTAMTSPSSEVTLRHNVAVGNQVGIDAPYATQEDWNIGVEAAP